MTVDSVHAFDREPDFRQGCFFRPEGYARIGIVSWAHGLIEVPVFLYPESAAKP